MLAAAAWCCLSCEVGGQRATDAAVGIDGAQADAALERDAHANGDASAPDASNDSADTTPLDAASGEPDAASADGGGPVPEGRFGFQLFPALQLRDLLGRWNEAKAERTYELLDGLDVRWLRIGLSWKTVEQQRGVYDWAVTDMVIDELSGRGLKLLVLVGGAPDWAGTPSDDAEFTTPDDPADFAAFVRVAAARYSGRVVAWELWNEPNVPNFWGGRESTPQEYLDLMIPAAAAIKAVDPEVVVVGGCPLVQFFQEPDYGYLQGLLDAGVLEHVDVLSAHIYSPMVPEAPEHFAQVLAEVTGRVEAAGGAELWLTEVGAPSRLLVPPRTPRPQEQADMAEAVWAASRSPQRMFWFQLIDGIYHCGVVDAQLSPKPAYQRLQALAAP